MQLTLIRQTGAVAAPAVQGLDVRQVSPRDIEALAQLYLESYGTEIAGDIEDAREEIRATFAGEYGEVLAEASYCLWESGKMVACVLTVDSPPWDDVADLVFIIDMFVAPAYRGKGLAQALMAWAVSRAPRGRTIGLRVESDNTAAVRVYQKLGFVER